MSSSKASPMKLEKTTSLEDETDDDRPLSPSELDISAITAASGLRGTPAKLNASLLSTSSHQGIDSPLHGPTSSKLEKDFNGDVLNLDESVKSNANVADGDEDKGATNEGGDGSGDDNEEESETESDSEDEGMAGGGAFDMASVTYQAFTEKGETISYTLPVACSQGNLPVAVLLWGMYQAKGVDPLTPDSEGNNPIHYAALAEKFEVLDFIMQQTGGYDSQKKKLIDSRNSDKETALVRAATKVSGVSHCAITKQYL